MINDIDTNSPEYTGDLEFEFGGNVPKGGGLSATTLLGSSAKIAAFFTITKPTSRQKRMRKKSPLRSASKYIKEDKHSALMETITEAFQRVKSTTEQRIKREVEPQLRDAINEWRTQDYKESYEVRSGIIDETLGPFGELSPSWLAYKRGHTRFFQPHASFTGGTLNSYLNTLNYSVSLDITTVEMRGIATDFEIELDTWFTYDLSKGYWWHNAESIMERWTEKLIGTVNLENIRDMLRRRYGIGTRYI